jgi:PKD repeat protein
MKKFLIFISFISMLSFSSFAQTVTVSGVVTEINTGEPVSDYFIFIVADSTNGSGYVSLVLTNEAGEYSDSFEATQPEGMASVFTFDCNGEIFQQDFEYGPDNYSLVADFDICAEFQFEDCQADFWYYQMEDLNVEFMDYSWPEPDSWTWDFGDGNTSTEQNPIHQYAEAGSYVVTLTIFDEETECESTVSYDVWVDDFNYDCYAWYFWTPSWQEPLAVEFYDFSFFEPGSWSWDFGDGNTSTEQNPVHVFAEPGEYEVTLNIVSADSSCIESYTEMVYVEEFNFDCHAEFWYYQVGELTVQFEEYSFPQAETWFWEFGDGGTSEEPNPIYTYAEPGSYEVCLTITNDEFNCEDTQCFEIWVDSTGFVECYADFWYYQMDELTIEFMDYSWPQPDSWAWDFGDGNTSTEQNPVHQYAEAGVYPVTLTIYVEATDCESTITWDVWVDDFNYDCYAWYFWYPSWQEPLAVEFHDFSFFEPGSWFWDFGDGNTSTEQNPIHVYAEEGEYEVTLNIVSADSNCVESYTETVYVEEFNFDCYADFWYYQIGDLTVQFEDYSFPTPETWFWEFGDGTTSNEPNPIYTYAEAGSYEVCLTITNEEFECEDTRCFEIFVDSSGFAECQAIFWYYQSSDLTVEFLNFSFPSAAEWSWDFGDGNTSAELNPIHQYAEAGAYPVTLSMFVPETGCESTVTYDILVYDYSNECQAAFFYYPSPDNPLETFFYDLSLYQGDVEYLWEFGDGGTSTEQNPIYTYDEEGEYEVCLTISSPDTSCFSTFCEIVYIGGFPSDCENQFTVLQLGDLDFQFDGEILNGASGEYLWDFGDGTIGDGQSITHTYAEEGTYFVCLTTIAGGNTPDTCIYISCQVVVTGNGGQPMQASFNMQQDSANPMMMHFYDVSNGNPAGWLWDFGDGHVSSEQHPVHEFTDGGVYDVCLTIFGQGMTDSYCQQIEMSATFVSVGESFELLEVGEAFPNPADDIFYVDLKLSETSNVNLTLINHIGQSVYQQQENVPAGGKRLEFSVNDYPAGIYNLLIQTGEKRLVRKVVIR